MRVKKIILIFFLLKTCIYHFFVLSLFPDKLNNKINTMEKKIKAISNEIKILTKSLNSLKEKMEGIRFIDFVRSCGSDVILLEKKIEILTMVRNNLQTNPTQDMFDRQLKFICRLGMNNVGFSSGAFTHPVETLCNDAEKEVYKFLTYLE
jgi:hypothetical protein